MFNLPIFQILIFWKVLSQQLISLMKSFGLSYREKKLSLKRRCRTDKADGSDVEESSMEIVKKV